MIVAILTILTLFVESAFGQGLVLPRTEGVAYAALVAIAIGAVALHVCFTLRKPPFSTATVGILVLQPSGGNGRVLQRRIVSSLNSRIQGLAVGAEVEVHSGQDVVAEDLGLPAAHGQAREIGQQVHAKLVIWGEKIDERRFFPRITIVDPLPNTEKLSERTYDVQNIAQLRLPSQVIDSPVCLAQFVMAFSCVQQDDYERALLHCEEAMASATKDDLPDLCSFTGSVAVVLAVKDEMASKIWATKAIELLTKAETAYGQDRRADWASVQINLGIAYSLLADTGAQPYFSQAIECNNRALTVFGEKTYPDQWARVQTNLGGIYGDLQSGSREENLTTAIDCLQSALRIRTKAANPVAWALINTNLGIAHRQLSEAVEVGKESLVKAAINYLNEALTVTSRQKVPATWANIQNNLGVAYSTLEPPDATSARECLERSLEVFTREKFPLRWAMAEVNLANTCLFSPGPVDTSGIDKAIGAAEEALKVFSPVQARAFVSAEKTLALACIQRAPRPDNPIGRESYLMRATTAAEMALKACGPEKDARTWASLKLIAADLYMARSSRSPEYSPKAERHLTEIVEAGIETRAPEKVEAAKSELSLKQLRNRLPQLPGNMVDAPSESPLNKSRVAQMHAIVLEGLAKGLGIRGRVMVRYPTPTTFLIGYYVTEEDAGNPRLSLLTLFVDAINS